MLIASGNQTEFWQIADNKQVGELSSPTRLHAATISPDGKWVAASVEDGTVRIWELGSGRIRHILRLSHQPGVASTTGKDSQKDQIMFSPDGQYLAVASEGGQVGVWNLTTNQLMVQTGNDGILQRAIAFSPNSQKFAATVRLVNGREAYYAVQIWNLVTGQMVDTLAHESKSIESIQFSPDGTLVATAGMDGTARLWAAEPGSEFPVLSISDQQMQGIAFRATNPGESIGLGQAMAAIKRSPEPEKVFDQIVAVSSEGRVQSWHLPLPGLAPRIIQEQSFGESARPTIATSAELNTIAFSSNAQLLAMADQTGKLTIQAVQPDGKLTQQSALELPPPGEQQESRSPAKITIRQFAFSPDNQTLLGVADNYRIYLWKVASGRLTGSLQGHSASVEQAQFSADGQKIVSASRDRTVRVWAVDSGKTLKTLSQTSPPSSAKFNPDGTLLVIASWDGTAKVVDAKTGAERVILTGHRGALLDASFSLNGQILVTASTDGTARLWDAQTGTEQAILRPPGATAAIQRAFFSPDQRYVATVSRTGKLYIWAASWEKLLELARDRTSRPLKPEECLRYLRLPPNACPQPATAAVEWGKP